MIKDAVLSMIGSASFRLELKSLVAAVILFAPASVLLGFVTPYSVKLRTISLADSGKTVGRLYALSTVGSIVGTFAAGFILIPFVGSTRTLYLIAALLFGVSIILAPFAFTRANFAILTVFVFGAMGGEISSYYMHRVSGLVDIDTQYSRVQIYNSRDEKTGREFRAIATDPFFAQSSMYLDDGSPVFEYVKYFDLINHFKPDHKNTLMIGGAGYTVPREYLKNNPEARIDVVEIDPKMTELAREYFNLKDDPRLTIFHEDGRVYLNRSESAKYDAVFVDAFGSLFSIPYQLTTVEAIRHIHRVLKNDGIVIVNIGSALTGPASKFLQAEYATYKQVFPEVLLFKVRPERADDELQNIVLIAINSPPAGELASELPSLSKEGWPPLWADGVVPDGVVMTNNRLLSNRYTGPIDPLKPLTDDLGPVEYYNSIALPLYHNPK
ncbi:MAG: fused MFS/spermidine synthase [Acidobacteria bacterium]|nr:fused MFS/spermidine synthase [Acidobacteriota bacterium]